VTEALRSGWISSAGKFLEEFEARWAAYCGRKHGVAVSNGSVALESAIACLDLEPGDEVIVPDFTIISCATAVIAAGAVPVFVDANPRTWCIDTAQIEEQITPRTRAIMPVHIYGHPVDMEPVLRLAAAHELAVIEDAAEAHGAEYLLDGKWRRCGSFGELSCFSFYANKLVTTGEGGMVVTDNDELAEQARSLRNLCFRSDRRFLHDRLGFNFRLTNLQAALGVAQIERMDEIVARKRAAAVRYTAALCDVSGLTLPIEERWARSVFWMYGVVLGDEIELGAEEFALRLRAEGVDTRPFFVGMHEQPALRARGLARDGRYPVSERLARRGLYLPSGVALTDGQIDAVAAAVRASLT
jgi:perosamine synthetase